MAAGGALALGAGAALVLVPVADVVSPFLSDQTYELLKKCSHHSEVLLPLYPLSPPLFKGAEFYLDFATGFVLTVGAPHVGFTCGVLD